MNIYWTSLKKYRKTFLFLSIVFIIGTMAGFMYFNKVDDSVFVNFQENFININFNSNIIYHLIFLPVILFFSLFIIGYFIGLFLYFYEALSIGFICGAFFSTHGITGLIYSIIYVLVFKIVYVIFLLFILIKIFDLTRNIMGYLILRKDVDLKNLAINNFITIVKYNVIILIYDLFLIFFGNNVLSIFHFLI